MSLRYWVKTDLQDNPLTLFRLGGEEGGEFLEQEWHGAWEDTDRLVRAISKGEFEYEEVTEPTARRLFPQAFEG